MLRFSKRICGNYNLVTAIPMSQFVVLLRAYDAVRCAFDRADDELLRTGPLPLDINRV